MPCPRDGRRSRGPRSAAAPPTRARCTSADMAETCAHRRDLVLGCVSMSVLAYHSRSNYVAHGRPTRPCATSPLARRRGVFHARIAVLSESSRRGNHEADRSPGPHQEPRDGRRGGHVRPPRRGDPPRLRPADRLVDPPHPRAPRAGRRAHGVGLRARDRPARCRDGHERSGGDQHRHAARATRTWTRSRSS